MGEGGCHQSPLLPCVGLWGEETATHMTQQNENSRGSCAPTGRTLAHGRHGRPRPRPVLQRLSTSCHVTPGSWHALCGSAVQDRCPGSKVAGHLSGAILWSRSPRWWVSRKGPGNAPQGERAGIPHGSPRPQLPSAAPSPATCSLQTEGSLWATPTPPPSHKQGWRALLTRHAPFPPSRFLSSSHGPTCSNPCSSLHLQEALPDYPV